MKYIRTKDGRIAEIKENMVVRACDDATRLVYKEEPYICVLNGDDDILKQADTIEELFDEFVLENEIKTDEKCSIMKRKIFEVLRKAITETMPITKQKCFGAIWTNKGLIYVAKMNNDGEFELL